MTYQTLLQNAVDELAELGVEDAQVDTSILMEEATGLAIAAQILHADDEVPKIREEAFRALMERRLNREPVQLILGSTEFMGLKFKVDGNELIPRQDTEVLVEKVLEYTRGLREDAVSETSLPSDAFDLALPSTPASEPTMPSLLDLCTGSGCIAIALAKNEVFSCVCAGDISEEALTNARENATALEADIDFRLGDMTEAFEDEKFDIITANPPYIRSAEIEDLMPEVKDYDPILALDGGADGLIFYRRLAHEARQHLTKGGAIFMEIGYDQAEAVKKIFINAGYRNIEVTKDYSGLDRVVSATYM